MIYGNKQAVTAPDYRTRVWVELRARGRAGVFSQPLGTNADAVCRACERKWGPGDLVANVDGWAWLQDGCTS